jgi:NADH-quinone oxidoreductase subunit L
MYKYVLVAMAPLAALAISFGWFMEDYREFITKALPDYEMSHSTHHWAWLLGSIVIALALTGIVIAYKKYAGKGAKAWKRDEEFEQTFLYRLVSNQYYIPHFYDQYIVQPYTIASAKFWEIDKAVVDGTVDMIGKIIYKAGDISRGMQDGNLSSYLNWMGVGTLLLVLAAAVAAVIG